MVASEAYCELPSSPIVVPNGCEGEGREAGGRATEAYWELPPSPIVVVAVVVVVAVDVEEDEKEGEEEKRTFRDENLTTPT